MMSRKAALAVLAVVAGLLVLREVQWRISDSRRDAEQERLANEARQYKSDKWAICFQMSGLVKRRPGAEQLSESIFFGVAAAYSFCVEDELSLKIQGFMVGYSEPPMEFDEGIAWLRRELPKAEMKFDGPGVRWKPKGSE